MNFIHKSFDQIGVIHSLLFNLKALKQTVFSFCRSVYNDFDAVLEVDAGTDHVVYEQGKFQKLWNLGPLHMNVRFLFPCLFNAFYFVDTFVIFWKVNFTVIGREQSDCGLIGRKLFSTNLWSEWDVVIPVAMIWSSGVLFAALCHDLQDSKLDKMVAVVGPDGKVVRMVQYGNGMKAY